MLAGKVWRYILKHNLISEGDRIVVAVSGGPDSLCLLHLLNSFSRRLKISLCIAHLNHGMRPEAVKEAETLRSLAESWRLPVHQETADVVKYAAEQRLSVEAAGRKLRYSFLQKVADRGEASKIAVGHHRDDQAETVIFNILRGTGPDGLAAMRPIRPLGAVSLIRPLLGVTRREIETYCRDNGLSPAHDSSNLQTCYTRNRIRLELLPYLESRFNPRVKESLARLSVLAAEDRHYLQSQAVRALKHASLEQDGRLILKKVVLRKLPPALSSRVVRLALERFARGGQVKWSHICSLLALAADTGPGRELNLPGGIAVYSDYNKLVITADRLLPALLIGEKILRVPGRTLLPGGGWIETCICRLAELTWPPLPEQGYLDYDRLPSPLVARARWPGARFYPQGAGGGKKLKELFIDWKVPKYKRDSWPLIVTLLGEIVWVAGLRIADPYRVTERTESVMVLKWQDKSLDHNC